MAASTENIEMPNIDDTKCIITTEEREFLVDKELLCSKSIYFQTMFQCEMKESISSRVTLNDIPGTVVEIILKFIESGTIDDDLDEDLLIRVIGSSHMLMVDDLHEQCCKRIKINDSNYSKMAQLTSIYQNFALKKSVADFQSQNFNKMKQDLLRLSRSDLEFLLSNTAIDVTVNEIIDFLVTWGKTNEENIVYLPRLLSLVNMSSMTEDSLDQYVNVDPLISNNTAVRNAFMETASVSHVHFMCIADIEFRAYSIINNDWSSAMILPKQCLYASNRLYCINGHFYALNSTSSRKMEVLKLNPCGSGIISTKRINVDSRSQIILINKCLYIISCDTFSQQTNCTSVVFTLFVHVYDVTTERLKLLATRENCCSGGVLSVASSHTCLDILVPDCIFRLYLNSCQWKKIVLPVSLNCDHSRINICFLGYFDHLYFFHLQESVDYSRGNFTKKQCHEEDKDWVSLGGEKFLWINKTANSHHQHDMYIYKLASNDTWQEFFVYREFPYRDVQPLYPPVSKNRRLPLIYFAAWNSSSFLQYDFRSNSWKEIPIDVLYNWQALVSLNYICKQKLPAQSHPNRTEESVNSKCTIS